MKDAHKKLIVLGIIWIGVGAMGYHAFVNVLPSYGYFGGNQPQRFDRDYWRQAQEEEQEFRRTPLPKKLRIDVDDAEPSPRRDWITNHEGRIRGRNATLASVYRSIRRLRDHQVDEMPERRYDIEILAPEGLTPETIATALLKEADMESREILGLVEGYRFTAGSPPADAPPPPQNEGRGRGGQQGDWTLNQMRWRLGRVGVPVEVDDAVRDKRPVSGQATIPRRMNGDELMKFMAAQYGVAVQKADVETTRVLLFDPDDIDSVAVGNWLREAGTGSAAQ